MVAFEQFSIGNCFKSSKIFVSIVHIIIVSEKIEFEFCRAPGEYHEHATKREEDLKGKLEELIT